MDVDYIAAKQAIERLEKLLSDTPHGEREQIADDIIEFVDVLEAKYSEHSEVEGCICGKKTSDECLNKCDHLKK